jgi:hypothetical protein
MNLSNIGQSVRESVEDFLWVSVKGFDRITIWNSFRVMGFYSIKTQIETTFGVKYGSR